ncbi:hypothetical protein NPS74_20955, partial [Cutibacterium acnes subsp. acnes]|nr:hypothetical protein [Cutibacterium acnes subsp. acnes]
ARPARQMIATAWYYLTTDQWRYDGARAESIASPLGSGSFAGRTTADCMVYSARRGWTPSYPTFTRNPLDLADEAAAAGMDPAGYIAQKLTDGS